MADEDMDQNGAEMKNRADARPFAQRFMDVTGRLRAVFGPAQSSSRDHEMTEENKRSLADMEQAMQSQYTTVTRPDGSTYLVPRDS